MIALEKYGVREQIVPTFEVIYLCDDPKLGRWITVRAEREEVELRITRGGFIRASRPRRSGKVRASGVNHESEGR